MEEILPLESLSSASMPSSDSASEARTLAEASAEMERRRLQAFLDMPDSEYEAALERVVEIKGKVNGSQI